MINQSKLRIYCILFSVLVLVSMTACSTTSSHTPHKGIAQYSANVYALMDYDFRGIFGSEESLIERNLLFVDEFALERAKLAIPVEARIHGVGVAANWAWFYYKFALVEPNSPEANKKFSDIVVERDERWGVEFETTFISHKTAGEFEKLMEVYEQKKKGSITEAEYEQQKLKILTGPK